jgi:hypothetical protein
MQRLQVWVLPNPRGAGVRALPGVQFRFTLSVRSSLAIGSPKRTLRIKLTFLITSTIILQGRGKIKILLRCLGPHCEGQSFVPRGIAEWMFNLLLVVEQE